MRMLVWLYYRVCAVIMNSQLKVKEDMTWVRWPKGLECVIISQLGMKFLCFIHEYVDNFMCRHPHTFDLLFRKKKRCSYTSIFNLFSSSLCCEAIYISIYGLADEQIIKKICASAIKLVNLSQLSLYACCLNKMSYI